MQGRPQKAHRRTGALAAMHGEIGYGKTLDLCPMKISEQRISQGPCGRHQAWVDGPVRNVARYRQRSVAAMEGGCTAPVAFRAPKVAKRVRVAPTVEPCASPIVVVGGAAPRIHHAVDGCRAAEHFTARCRDDA